MTARRSYIFACWLITGLLWTPGLWAKGIMPEKDMVIAVADFTGKDPEISEGIAETLLTDLAKSSRLHLVERKQLRRALSEVKLSASGLTDSKKVKKLGTMVGADRMIVGSYSLASDSIIINARLLDVATGQLTQGGAENIQGSREDIFTLVHRLANRFHKRLTGEWIPDIEPDSPDVLRGLPSSGQETSRTGEPTDIASSPFQQEIRTVVSLGIMQGFTDGTFRPKASLTEREFDIILQRLKGHIRPMAPRTFTLQNPLQPVTRVRVLAALVRLEVPSEQFEAMIRPMDVLSIFEDAADIPRWARTYIAVAVDQNYLPRSSHLYPNIPATRGMVAALIARMLPSPPEEEVSSLPPESPDGCSGLIVDARGLDVSRSMSPRVIAADGRVVYPQRDRLPTIGYIQEHGIVSYVHSVTNAPKAGPRPIVVRAQGVAGSAHDTIIISPEDASRILEENQRSHFLWRWQVCFVVDHGR